MSADPPVPGTGAGDSGGDASGPPALPDPLALFPLGTALFPGGLMPLRVFEPRYRAMVRECLERDAPFAVVALRRGREVQAPASGQAPPVEFERVGTLARLVDTEPADDGTLLVRVRGGERVALDAARVRQRDDGLWLADGARVLDDGEAGAPARTVPPAYVPLAEALRRLLAQAGARGAAWAEAPYRFDDAAWVAHRFAEVLPLPASERHRLLVEPSPLVRLARIAELVGMAPRDAAPPDAARLH